MQNAYVVTGTLTDKENLKLDEALPISPTRVRVVVQPIASSPTEAYPQVMAAIRERQQQRGRKPPTRDQVDEAIRAERQSWDE